MRGRTGAKIAAIFAVGTLLAVACSSSGEVGLVPIDPTSDLVPLPTVTPGPTGSDSGSTSSDTVTAGSATAEPEPRPTPPGRATGSLVFRSPDGLFRLADDATIAPLAGAGAIEWVDIEEDGTVLAVGADQIHRWHPDGRHSMATCPACTGAVADPGAVIAIARGGVMHRFEPADLSPINTIDTVLVDELDPDGFWDHIEVVGLAASGEIIVTAYSGDFVPSAYGGPFAFWALNATGDGRFIAGTEGNVGAYDFAFSPDRRSLLFNNGFRGGFCAHGEAVSRLDLDDGSTTDLPTIWNAGLGPPGGEQQFVSNLIYTDDSVFAIATIAQGFDPSSDCQFRWPSALFRWDGSAWEVHDSGDVDQLYPLGPSTKAYVIMGDDESEGDLYWERNGEAVLISRAARIMAALPAQADVDLVPPARMSAQAAQTHDRLLDAAGLGSTEALAEAAGENFNFSFGLDTDPVAYWDELNECCFVDVPTMVASLLSLAPLVMIDLGDGTKAATWSEPSDLGWRVAIDQDGKVLWIISGD